MSTRAVRKSHCQACSGKDTKRMVSCCYCESWWHFDCVGVDDSIAEPERIFICPNCQKPSPMKPTDHTPSSVAASGCSIKTGSGSGRSVSLSLKAKRARLQLEKLEAKKPLALRKLEVVRREQEQQHEQVKLQIEEEIMEETFRLREVVELEDDAGVDGGESQQSSFSKVEQWQNQQENLDVQNVTVLESAEGGNAEQVGVNIVSVTNGTQAAGQDGVMQPPGVRQGVLSRALEGMSLNETGPGPSLGGFLDRTSSTLLQVGNKQQIGSTNVNAMPRDNRVLMSQNVNPNQQAVGPVPLQTVQRCVNVYPRDPPPSARSGPVISLTNPSQTNFSAPVTQILGNINPQIPVQSRNPVQSSW